MNIIKLFHQFISPRFVYWLSNVIIPYVFVLALILIVFGLYQGIFIAPPDYLQGDAYRIIYIHVPAAYLSLLGYVILAVSSFWVLYGILKLVIMLLDLWQALELYLL